ncbi:MAG: hypothetical protein ACREA9_12795 [Pyrinomonadaceae bacterium]
MAATIVTLVAIAPQLYFCFLRGSQWNGGFAQTHGDESVYAAYLNALIDGRPRRNNPYTGRDDSPGQPVAESYLSVQSFPPVFIARLARPLHLSTAKILMGLTALIAFASALAIFWLLSLLTRDDRLAAAGVLLVLFLSSASLVAEYLLRVGDSNNYLPFLRRYLPAAPFPFLFLYCGMIYRMLTAEGKRTAVLYALGSGWAFAVLVYSYVYHWSFALVWTVCVAGFWLLFRKDRKQALTRFSLVAVLILAALAPYAYLMSRLGSTTADVHFLASSHAPDLLRLPEVFGLLTLAVIALLLLRGGLKANEPAVIYALAFAITPFFLFNQQILTGRSLQPFHFEVFVGNYSALLAAFLTAWFPGRKAFRLHPRMAHGLIAGFVCASILSGCAEAVLLSRHQLKGNLISDGVRPALLRLADLGRNTANGNLDTASVVYAPNFVVANSLPSTAPQPVLWAQYLFLFPDVTLTEDKERLAQFLYYKGVSFTDIDQYHLASLDNERAYYLSSLISRGRFNPRLSVAWKPITPAEVRGALDYYANYVATFDRNHAAHPELAYLLVKDDAPVDLAHFDRWYERDSAERVGGYLLFRVRLKSQ